MRYSEVLIKTKWLKINVIHDALTVDQARMRLTYDKSLANNDFVYPLGGICISNTGFRLKHFNSAISIAEIA